jgi:hypothetical protein
MRLAQLLAMTFGLFSAAAIARPGLASVLSNAQPDAGAGDDLVTALAFTPGVPVLASGCRDGRVCLWAPAKRKAPLRTYERGERIERVSWVVSPAAGDLLLAAADAGGRVTIRRRLEAIDDVRVTDLHSWDVGHGRRSCVVALVTSNPRAPTFYRDVVLAGVEVAHLTLEVERRSEEAVSGMRSARAHRYKTREA